MRRQVLLRPVKRIKQVEIVDQLLHLIHLVERGHDFLFGLLVRAVQSRDLFVGGLFQIVEHVGRQAPSAVGRRAALDDVAQGGVIGLRAPPDGAGLLAQQFLHILFHVIERIFAHEIVHPPGLLVELLIQLILFGGDFVQLLR